MLSLLDQPLLTTLKMKVMMQIKQTVYNVEAKELDIIIFLLMIRSDTPQNDYRYS